MILTGQLQTVSCRHPNGERKDYFMLPSFFLAARDGALCTPDKAEKEVGVVCLSSSLGRIGQSKSDCFQEQSL